MSNRFSFILVLALGVAMQACQTPPAETLFTQLSPSQTGIGFANTITPDDTLNVLYYMYLYNGAGVGVGDFNGDGLPDVFLAGNQVSSQCYLNQGNFKFAEVTQAAGLTTDRWATGVSVADVNADGLLDIYVCVAHNNLWNKSNANLLFVNQGVRDGVPIFKEMAEDYHLADTSYSTQAAFFDYDRDGDLDMYLLNNWLEKESHNRLRPKLSDGSALNTDKLYRNEGTGPNGHPVFREVSKAAGIIHDGYGLGVVISDLNKDGWPDIYVTNDFITNDLMYVNNGDGTFANQIAERLMHQSYNSMGTDVADYNNDGWSDIVALDMLPEGNQRQKMMMMKANDDRYAMMTGKFLHYQPQFVRNTLQLNHGNGTFSEIGQLAGVDKTDWSWAALLADYDNDGWKDLFVTNGYRKDITDLDYITYSQDNSLFGSDEFKRKNKKEMLKLIPEVKIGNYAYRNRGDLTFENVSQAWGLDVPSYSNGAAYADFDNDGDLDLVINNIDQPAQVFRNEASNRLKNNYLRIKLRGKDKNNFGIGAKVTLWAGGKMQYQELSPVRGYTSTVEDALHFGLGQGAKIDSLHIVWPSGWSQRLTAIQPNQTLGLVEKNATVAPVVHQGGGHWPAQSGQLPFQALAGLLAFKHTEGEHNDFKQQFTLPHKYSQNGFGLAVGDVNGDGLEDLYAGGAYGISGSFFLQTKTGQFQARKLTMDTLHEDMGVLLFDADGDRDLDLYVVSGGNERLKNVDYYQDRLYLNDGRGHFSLAAAALPDTKSSGSCVVAADYDQDGDLDLFVGGRVVPNQYPLPPRSYLLRNDSQDGQVSFTDATPTGLAEVGMVTAALWTDYDNDGRLDLALVGEFMPFTFFKNDQGKLTKLVGETGDRAKIGWWNSLSAGDFDNDGDTDYLAGNLGYNTKYKASDRQPVSIVAKDFDKNGMSDAFLSHYFSDGKRYLAHPRDNFLEQIPYMKKKFNAYKTYATTPFELVFGEEELADAYLAEANYFATSYIENQGNGKFVFRPLPIEAQLAPVYGMTVGDYNDDGHLDALMVGNSYAPEVNWGRYDASFGTYLLGNGQGGFEVVPNRKSGFVVRGDAKGLVEITLGQVASGQGRPGAASLPKSRVVQLVALNSEGIQAFANLPASGQRAVAVQPQDTFALLTLQNGKKRKQEFYWGSTYLSQSSRTLRIGKSVVGVELGGAKRKSGIGQ
jgi:enediyne biosynthesis protein E4